jgi:hypothetical protein
MSGYQPKSSKGEGMELKALISQAKIGVFDANGPSVKVGELVIPLSRLSAEEASYLETLGALKGK